MDPKGDRLRKIKMGLIKLPDSLLKSNHIILTPESPKMGGGGCLEGGPRPRPVLAPNNELKSTSPIITSNKKRLSSVDIPLPSDADIPLPSDADIPLPSDADIPLPKVDIIPLPSVEIIPLPKDEDIPLPSTAIIPLPAEKLPQQERKKIKVSLSHLEPRGDELLCRSCVMKFTLQHDYDTHLQSEEHQQVF